MTSVFIGDELLNVINLANGRSGGHLRLGLITFRQYVEVLHPMTADTNDVSDTLAGLTTAGGAPLGEASDEALREMLTDTECFSGHTDCVSSTNGFDTPLGYQCIKHAILVTPATR